MNKWIFNAGDSLYFGGNLLNCNKVHEFILIDSPDNKGMCLYAHYEDRVRFVLLKDKPVLVLKKVFYALKDFLQDDERTMFDLDSEVGPSEESE